MKSVRAIMLVAGIFMVIYTHILLGKLSCSSADQHEVAFAPTVLPRQTTPWAIFFNTYFAHGNETNGLRIVAEQLDQIVSSNSTTLKAHRAGGTIFFNSIGSLQALNQSVLDNDLCGPRSLKCKHMKHYENANEDVTLQQLYEYCQEHKNDNSSLRVAYVHNKGSHNGDWKAGRNEIWRRHLTAAALNEKCWKPPDRACNVCGLQFWPVWTAFFPGNMWTASCSYVNKLLPPSGFDIQMEKLRKASLQLKKDGILEANGYKGEFHMYGKKSEFFQGRFGLHRYASEHWIGSHPMLLPCDVSDTDGDLRHWGEMGGQGRDESDFVWSMAPRRSSNDSWWATSFKSFQEVLESKKLRMKEYFLLPGMLYKWKSLYNDTPPPSSWVWSWYPDGAEMRDSELISKLKQPRTVLTTNTSMDSLFTRPPKIDTIYDHENKFQCSLQSIPKHQWALARMVVFQRDGGRQLQNFMTHYGQVLPYESIVIIDHKGQDNETRRILDEYARRGAHVWRCEGSWNNKAEMWSLVVSTYKKDSDFLFPLDVDELVAVIRRDVHNETKDTIEWSKVDFINALGKLGDEGKSFKMEKALPIPYDCEISMQDYYLKNDSMPVAPLESRTSGYVGEIRQVEYIQRNGRDCMDKAFVRGKDFVSVDKGNHFGRTKTFQNVKLPSCIEEDSDSYFKKYHEIPDLLLLHAQSLGFSTWLLHGLRGAADYGYNNMDGKCLENKKGGRGRHYCMKWKAMYKSKFSPYELRNIYKEEMCPTSSKGLISIERVTAQLC